MTILKKISLLLLLTISFACSDDDLVEDPDLIGNWLLIEQYTDPGDGSGDFAAVESNRTLTFNEDGSFHANGDICAMSTATGTASTGVYSEVDGTMEVQDCAFIGFGITFTIADGHLIVNYPCIEACRQKYEKAD